MAALLRIIIAVCALASVAIASPAPKPRGHYCPPIRGPAGVRVRLPPAFNNGVTPKSWTPPPTGWYFKVWWMIYASNPQHQAFRNLQYDATPVDPTKPKGDVNDLFSFQLHGNSTIYTSYGVDTPHPTWPNVLEYAGTGILQGAFSEYSMLAWGCDSNGNPYYTSYSSETPLSGTPAGIDILSTSDLGPDKKTVDTIIKKLKALPNDEIVNLASNQVKMTFDGERRGLPRVVCDDYCKSNQNLLDILPSA